MDPIIVGIIGIAILIILLVFGFHIAICMGVAGLIGFIILNGWQPAITLAASQAFSVASNYDYSVIPLFMLMGLAVYTSGLANDIYDAMYRWFGKLPGGLMIATTFAAGIFGAASGSSIAAAVTFTKIAVPEMMKRGYHGGLACGAVAAAGTQSAMIPPSGLMVLYAILTEQSIGKCLMAGLLPGILSNLIYVGMVFGMALWKPKLLPRGASFSRKEKLRSLKNIWTIPLIGIIVLGGIYIGFFTPTEAAGIGAFMAILVSIISVGFKKAKIWDSLVNTLGPSVMIFTILIGAFIFGSFLATSRVPIQIAEIATGSGLSRFWILIIIIVMYFILGTFMSSTAMVVITMPVVFPIITSLGYDPIWFGVIIIKMCEIGVITPPVGLNVYAVKGAIGESVKLEDIFKGTFPFLLMDILTLAILIAFPSISLLIPKAMM